MPAMVSIPLTELDDLRNKNRTLTDQLAEVTRTKEEAERSDPDGRVEAVLQTLLAGLPIITFATANLDPETVRGWPYQDLSLFADLLETTPGVSYRIKELAVALRSFAQEAASAERHRSQPDPNEPCPLIEDCARGFGHSGKCADAEGTQLTP